MTPEQAAALSSYLEELHRWNQRLNLTSVPKSESWQRHVEESLELLEVAAPGDWARVVDVGSGIGIPGVVVAVVRPDLRMTLLEADRRKAAFLTHVAGLFGLHQVTVLALRAEDAARQSDLRESFDVALSRAAAPPPVLCELALPLLAVGGRLCALVGDATSAVAECEAAARACGGGQPLARGAVIIVPKEARTPERYPRRSGVPARIPLH
jgi:16S rRNA (guanine527-N7)-methyltransferase